MINEFYLLSTVVLSLLLCIIYTIPSGPECPKCKSHLNDKTIALAVKPSDKTSVTLKYNQCFRCGNKFNIEANGRKVRDDELL